MLSEVAVWADGWLPIGGSGLRAGLDALRMACDEVDRDPADLSVIPIGSVPEVGKLAYYAELGVTETVLRVPSAGRDEVLRALDAHVRFLDG